MKTALGGICAALSLVMFLISGALGRGQYAAAFLSGMLLLVISYKTGKASALCSYAVISAAGLLLSPEKTGVLLFIALLGYYPVLRSVLNDKLKKPAALIVKLLILVVTGSSYLYTVFYIFGINFVIKSVGKNIIFVISLLIYAILFLAFDLALGIFEKRYKKQILSFLDRIIR